MDSTVHTGVTRSTSGTALVSLSFPSTHGERVLFLLHVEAEPRDAKVLEDESVAIVRASLLGTEGEAWHRLDGALKELNGLFKGLLLSETVRDIHAIVAILDAEKTLHLSHAGRGEAYLLRGNSASQITEYVKGKPISAFVHISSGALEAGDTVVLSTQRLLRAMTPAQLVSLAARGDQIIDDIAARLDSEHEMAALAAAHIASSKSVVVDDEEEEILPLRQRSRGAPLSRRDRGGGTLSQVIGMALPLLQSLQGLAASAIASRKAKSRSSSLDDERRYRTSSRGFGGAAAGASEFIRNFLADLQHPQRKRRAHLLLLASAIGLFLVVWVVVRLSTHTQRSKTQAELQQLVDQISMEIRTADNRRLTGDAESANVILERAEERAKQVMDNESGLFRMEALNLLDRIHAKKEEINNIIRLSPRVVVNLSSKDPNVSAQGLVGVADGEFLAFDRQRWYHVLLNSVDEGRGLVDDELIIDGAPFSRYKSQVFLTTGNGIVEILASQPTSMKTEDPAGWVTGKDIETYLRFLYVLSEEHIYKYERLSNRYSAPVQYDVNADLTNALDMSIDGSVFVLKPKGEVLKLLRGEVQPFTIRNAPEDVLNDASKVYKVPGGNFYFLDPAHNRVIVATDGGAAGESSYLKQYVLEGDQLGKFQDLFVDADGAHLYLLDDKRLYSIDVSNK